MMVGFMDDKSKKIAKYSFLFLLIIGLSFRAIQLRRERLERDSLIKNKIMESKLFDKKLWAMKNFNLSLIETSNSEEKQCQTFDSLFKIELKEPCWVNITRNQHFWNKNSIIDKIVELFSTEESKAERAIYKEGNCFSESYLTNEVESARKEQYSTIGSKICTSYRNIIFGGGCAKETIVTKEMVDGVISDLKASLYSDVDKYPKKEKGFQIPLAVKSEYCKYSDDKKEVHLIFKE